jgi:hypothetical protein
MPHQVLVGAIALLPVAVLVGMVRWHRLRVWEALLVATCGAVVCVSSGADRYGDHLIDQVQTVGQHDSPAAAPGSR